MKLSIILPTYNNEKTLNECLSSIFSQKYKDFEVLLIDGGSNDNTLKISKKYKVSFIKNKKRNEEAARILGIKKAKGEFIAFIDADNVLPDEDWIEKMIKPFADKEIIFADTLYYSYREKDSIKVKYQALIGGDDPIIMYLGLHSRWSYLTNSWTDCPHKDYDEGEYLKSTFSNKKIPPMGSNGFLVRTDIARKFVKDSFIHSDFIYDLVENGYNCFAKVKIGIVHNQPKFFPNKIRRMQRRLKNEVKIKHDYIENKIFLKAIYIAIIPLFDMIKGMIRKPSIAWLFHPIACYGELIIYSYYNILKLINN